MYYKLLAVKVVRQITNLSEISYLTQEKKVYGGMRSVGVVCKNVACQAVRLR